jgi:alkylation response protein AidB-like acyl-CoA dehydrogenase
MNVPVTRKTVARPCAAELLTRAHDIAALARERAQQTEADRRVSVDMVGHMRKAGLFEVMKPRAFGGFEYGFDVLEPLVAAIAAGCGSTGWVYGLLASHQWLVAGYSRQAQDEYWADRDALSAGSYAPAGQGVAVEGGYRISGTWSFCSGCDNAQWLHLGAMLPGEAGAKPGFILVPATDYVIDDNWRTMGLAGTGSKNIVAKDAFVPRHRTVLFADLAAGQSPGAQVHGDPIFRQSFLAVLPATIVAPVLGMAEGALASFLEMVNGRVTRGAVAGGNRKMAEFATVQQRAAEASACIDAAKLLMYRDLAEAYDAVLGGDAANVDLRLRNRRDQAFCVKLLVQAVDLLFLAAGGQGLFLGHPLQRAWRDAHAAASHISLNWDSAGTMYGQHLVGLEPKGQY